MHKPFKYVSAALQNRQTNTAYLANLSLQELDKALSKAKVAKLTLI